MKKLLSLTLVAVIVLSCFTITSFAADSSVAAETENVFVQFIEFFLGEVTFVDGNFEADGILHTLYYKDSPLLMNIWDAAYESFWNFLIGLLNLFM